MFFRTVLVIRSRFRMIYFHLGIRESDASIGDFFFLNYGSILLTPKTFVKKHSKF